MRPGIVAHRAPQPSLDSRTDPLLRDAALAAVDAVNSCWERFDRAALVEEVKIGADGTPTYRLDDIVEGQIAAVAAKYGANVLSEELGFLDVGSARTLVIDPLDGSANAAAGVPLSCFSGVIVEDGTPREALTVWLEGGHVMWARVGEPVDYATSGQRELGASALGLLRPKVGAFGDTTEAWVALTRQSNRVRILSTSALEAMLVGRGAIDAFADPGSDTHRLVDLAAAQVFLPAAGGVVLDAFGREIEFDTDMTRRWSGIVAASESLGQQVAQVITEHVNAGVVV
ncbi:inositol monophosphatase [Epidermidibacterium keratini]|uniref:Inositol monophosphatase n=1 Tax=Epidermidibacterium keratini TaxID=1891644 RepID=A0A7M3T501_9ACTN|nr:inositol monophosphatase family protein [Epidermidibacterium keratini]QHB98849.1 inositol monophosphatase [Epidermidibacterium keratini]